jgi:hypothetical protein
MSSVSQAEETFVDVAGNAVTVQINLIIDKVAPQATSVSYSPNTTTNSGVIVTLTTDEPIVRPTDWE